MNAGQGRTVAFNTNYFEGFRREKAAKFGWRDSAGRELPLCNRLEVVLLFDCSEVLLSSDSWEDPLRFAFL